MPRASNQGASVWPRSTAPARRESSARLHTSGRNTRWTDSPRLLLAAITLLAAVLRLIGLNKSFWLDEGSSIAIVRGIAIGGHAVDSWSGFGAVLWARELNMGFYYLLLRLWLHLGRGEAFIRLLSVFPAVATVPLVYLLGKRLLDRQTGLWAALLLAVHGYHVALAQEARGYALVVFLCAVSYLAFQRAVEHSAARYWLIYVIATALAVYSHFFALLIVPAQLLALLWLPRNSVPWRGWAVSLAAVVALVTPAAVFVLTKDTGQLEWLTTTWRQIPRLLSAWAGNPAAVPVYLVLWFAAMRGWKRPESGSQSSPAGWRGPLLLAWLAIPTLIVLLVCAVKPILEARYLSPCLPAAVLLAAHGLRQITEPWQRRTLIATLLLSATGVAYTYYLPKEDWQGAAQYVVSQARSGDAIVVVPAWSRWPMEYYWSRWAVAVVSYELIEDNQAPARVQQIAGNHDRIWVVAYARRRGGYAETAALEKLLARHFHLEQARNLKQVRVELYAKAQP